MFTLITSLILYAINSKYLGWYLAILSAIRFFQLIEFGLFWFRMEKDATSSATHEEKAAIRESYKYFLPKNSLLLGLPAYAVMFMVGLHISQQGVNIIGLAGVAISFWGIGLLLSTFGTVDFMANYIGNVKNAVWWMRGISTLLICGGWLLSLTQAVG